MIGHQPKNKLDRMEEEYDDFDTANFVGLSAGVAITIVGIVLLVTPLPHPPRASLFTVPGGYGGCRC